MTDPKCTFSSCNKQAVMMVAGFAVCKHHGEHLQQYHKDEADAYEVVKNESKDGRWRAP